MNIKLLKTFYNILVLCLNMISLFPELKARELEMNANKKNGNTCILGGKQRNRATLTNLEVLDKKIKNKKMV